MATWKISNYHKKNCVEVQHWSKDGKNFTYSEGFRWGTFFKEDDDQPDVDLKNPDGFEPYWDEWELDMMDDGCWGDYDWGDLTEEEIAEIEAIIDEEGIFALEEHGWCNTENDVILNGPLLLENTDTGESWNGDDE